MKGLLLKDWYLTVKYMGISLLISGLFLVMSTFQQANLFFLFYPAMMVALLPINLCSYDEREKWTVYVQSMPVSRAAYVTGRYLYTALCIGIYLILLASLHGLAGTEGLGALFALSLSMGLLLPALMLPLILYFGAEKGRIVYLLAIGAVCGGAAALSMSRGAAALTSASAPPVRLLAPLCIVLYALSWRVSIKLYEKREL